jgi:superfamily I DNA and/or RNA helicase
MAIDTVDGFRGREKTAVVVSLVRSPPDGEVGLLEDPRRFNVALTRARGRAVVVGDADTVAAAPTFESFSRSPASAGPRSASGTRSPRIDVDFVVVP